MVTPKALMKMYIGLGADNLFLESYLVTLSPSGFEWIQHFCSRRFLLQLRGQWQDTLEDLCPEQLLGSGILWHQLYCTCRKSSFTIASSASCPQPARGEFILWGGRCTSLTQSCRSALTMGQVRIVIFYKSSVLWFHFFLEIWLPASPPYKCLFALRSQGASTRTCI